MAELSTTMNGRATTTLPQARARAGGRGRLVLLAVCVLAAVLAFRMLPVNDWLLAFVTWIRGAGATGMAIFVLAYVLACVLLLPGLVLTLGAGFAYGVATGIPLVWVSANLGAAVAFLLGTDAAYVSGQVLFVDAGRQLFSSMSS